MSNFISWLEKHLIACPVKKYAHIDCIGCGFQRSCILLMKGDVAGSFKMYPGLIPILVLVLAGIAHLIFRFRHGAACIKYLQVITGLFICISYFYKIINQHNF
jgi:hypothetical protein